MLIKNVLEDEQLISSIFEYLKLKVTIASVLLMLLIVPVVCLNMDQSHQSPKYQLHNN